MSRVAELQAQQAELEKLCRKFHVEELYLFGSATRDDFEPGRSDYDFVARFADLGWQGSADRYFGFIDALEKLLDAPVDIVELDTVRNPYLRKEIEETRVPLYAA